MNSTKLISAVIWEHSTSVKYAIFDQMINKNLI